jgi:hypothetical protein
LHHGKVGQRCQWRKVRRPHMVLDCGLRYDRDASSEQELSVSSGSPR